MSSERSISPDPLPQPHVRPHSGSMNGKDKNIHESTRNSSSSAGQKRRRDHSDRSRTPVTPRSVGSRSPSRGSIGKSRSPMNRRPKNYETVSPPPKIASSSSKRRCHDDESSGRRICSLCPKDVEASKRLFGILDNCDHVFCYDCIVSWKRSKYNNAESESCPVCRVRSAFITPSKHWYENKDEKNHILKKHRKHLKTLPCQYYLRHGFCRYLDRCFYDHTEAAKQYRQQKRHSRERDRDRDSDRDRGHHSNNHRSSYTGSRSHYRTPSPPSSSSRHSSSRHRERVY